MRNARFQWIQSRVPVTLAAAEGTRVLWPAHDPRLSPRDEIIFLLHTAAEIEHSLLVQYLYAAWSIPPNPADKLKKWRTTILGIAKQEMGHLMTVQNVL